MEYPLYLRIIFSSEKSRRRQGTYMWVRGGRRRQNRPTDCGRGRRRAVKLSPYACYNPSPLPPPINLTERALGHLVTQFGLSVGIRPFNIYFRQQYVWRSKRNLSCCVRLGKTIRVQVCTGVCPSACVCSLVCNVRRYL